MIGKTIDHYYIIEEIGTAGLGMIYKARDLKLDRLVMLKAIDVPNNDADALASFKKKPAPASPSTTRISPLSSTSSTKKTGAISSTNTSPAVRSAKNSNERTPAENSSRSTAASTTSLP